MFRCSKTVAWRNWEEWKETYHMLYSKDIKEIQWGCNRVMAWASKQVLPIAIEVTASLLQELHNPEKNTSALSLAIIRFINGVVEPFKNTNLSVPISTIGASYGVPDFVVTIRHLATHGKMPSFEFATIGAIYALEWLQKNYWEVQLNEINSIEQELRQQLMLFLMNSSKDFEQNYSDILMSFGIKELIKLVLNKNQKKKVSAQFQENVLLLMKNMSKKKEVKSFNASFIMKLAEETAKGDQIASSWLDYFSKNLKNDFPFDNVSLIFQWANPVLLGNAIPKEIFQELVSQSEIKEEDLSQDKPMLNKEELKLIPGIKPRWPPTSIGYLPVSDDGCLTLADDEFEFVEPGEDEPEEEEVNNDENDVSSLSQNQQISSQSLNEERILEIW